VKSEFQVSPAAAAGELGVRSREYQVIEGVSEAEWLASTDPGSLCHILGYLQYHAGYRISERKWRRFALACVRRVAQVFKDWRTPGLLDAVDQFADGIIGEQELNRLWMLAGDPPSQDGHDPEDCPPEQRAAAYAGTALGVAATGRLEAFEARNAAGWAQEAAEDPEAESQAQVALLRDIFGNPFHPVKDVGAWRPESVVGVAMAIYTDERFDDLPILGDALEEAGCSEGEVLAHCRAPGPHVRGCWPVDLLLAKE
jgi:hypothetical protein